MTCDEPVTDVYVKVNYAPYLVHVDLLESVDVADAVARFHDQTLELRLRKVGTIDVSKVSSCNRPPDHAKTMGYS